VSGFVLDNSVTMRWCFDAGAHAYADQVLEQLETQRGTAYVPVLWRYEVSAVLVRAEIRGVLAASKAAEFLNRLAALDIRIDVENAARVLTDVRGLAIRHRLTSYDAAYLELALRRNLPMATLDEELLAACKAAGVTCLFGTY
jgi:predicted nucleic acid-binding protein